MASVAGPRPACGVHPIWCRRPGSSGGRLVSGRLVSGRLVSGQLGSSSGDPAVRPSAVRCPLSGVRPSAVRPRPSGRVRLVPPVRCGGRPSPQEPSRSRWAAAPSSGSVNGRAGLGRATLRRRCGHGSRLAARGGRACRVTAVLGVGWATTVGGGCGACRRGGRAGEGRWAGRRDKGCGPGAAPADGGRSWLAAGSTVTCGNGWWACQDLNLGPHPDPKIHR
jgi:hypothetical protein